MDLLKLEEIAGGALQDKANAAMKKVLDKWSRDGYNMICSEAVPDKYIISGQVYNMDD